MTKYIQTNQEGYIVSLTSEPLLAGLFGALSGDHSTKSYIAVSDEEAQAINTALQSRHSEGKGLRIDDVVLSPGDYFG